MNHASSKSPSTLPTPEQRRARFVKLRKECRFSQFEVSVYLHYGRRRETINRWERGKGALPEAEIAQLEGGLTRLMQSTANKLLKMAAQFTEIRKAELELRRAPSSEAAGTPVAVPEAESGQADEQTA